MELLSRVRQRPLKMEISMACFECRRRKGEHCVLFKSQLKDIKKGERLTVHFAVPGFGPTSVTGVLDQEYRENDPAVVVRVGSCDLYGIGVDLI